MDQEQIDAELKGTRTWYLSWRSAIVVGLILGAVLAVTIAGAIIVRLWQGIS